jgi:ribonuclease HI
MVTKQQYVEFLISTIGNYTGSKLADHLNDVSHDVITDYLRADWITTRTRHTSHRSPPRSLRTTSGHIRGIYREWYGDNGAEKQVSGFQGAVYKGFPTQAEAERWQKEQTERLTTPAASQLPVKAPQHQAAIKPSAVATPADGKIVVYTDGACTGNPGPGGYAIVILNDGQRQELSSGHKRTTNYRMELMTCIVALQALLAGSHITLHSDSKSVVRGINEGWAKRWRANHWWRNRKERAENPDLWEQLLDLCEQR